VGSIDIKNAGLSDSERAKLRQYWSQAFGNAYCDALLDGINESVSELVKDFPKNPPKKRVAKKKPDEPIESRFNILDLRKDR